MRFVGRICTHAGNLHPFSQPVRCIVPCIIVYQISHLSTQILIQYLGTSFLHIKEIHEAEMGIKRKK